MFIMGGGEGSTVREALKHKDIEKVVMCDIDKVWSINHPIKQNDKNFELCYISISQHKTFNSQGKNLIPMWECLAVFQYLDFFWTQNQVMQTCCSGCRFLPSTLTANLEAYRDERLQVAINDAK